MCSNRTNKRNYYGACLLFFLVAQNSSAVLLGRCTRTKYDYNVQSMLMVAEALKLILSLVLEAYTYNRTLARESGDESFLHIPEISRKRSFVCERWKALKSSIYHNILLVPHDALKLTIPALLYLLQNSLVYYSIDLLPVPLFQVTQQTKLITTAILSSALLERSYNLVQWLSLLLFGIGTAVCTNATLSQSRAMMERGLEQRNSDEKIIIGILLLFLSNLSSSVASIYFEFVVKGKGIQQVEQKKPPSIWMRNIQLATFTLVILTVQYTLSKHGAEARAFFYDFSILLWIQIVIFAAGGLLVASVIKYADSVKKSLATGLSVIFSSALSLTIERSAPLSASFLLGSFVAVTSCLLFDSPNFAACHNSSRRRNDFVACSLLLFMVLVLQDFGFKGGASAPSAKEKLPGNWKELIHIHIWQSQERGNDGCGGCMVLWELADSISELGISTSSTISRCPNAEDLSEPLSSNKTIALVYPEIVLTRCEIRATHTIVHVRWILAPLSSRNGHEFDFRSWSGDDLVFHYASSCAVYPDNLSPSNILQVMTHPRAGDKFDLLPSELNRSNREGTGWTVRKGNRWHDMGKIGRFHEMLPRPHSVVNNPDPTTLKSIKFFVSYDPYTFYSYSAAMSGAISIVVPLPNVPKHAWVSGSYVGEYIRENGGGLPGIAYGINEEEIKFASATMSELRGFLLKVRQWGKTHTVERFARDCYRKGEEWTSYESALFVDDAYTNFYNENGTLKVYPGA